MDVAVDPGLGNRRRIGPHKAAVTVGKIEHEDMRLLLDAADHHHGLAEISLPMSWRMRQRHEHLLATLIPLAHVIPDDRVAAGEPALVSKPVKHSLGRMALLARNLHVPIKPMIDRRNERIQLGTPDRQLTLIAGRRRIRHHLGNAVARYVEMLCSLTPAHAFPASQTDLQI